MQFPNFLKKGDFIGVVSPAGKIDYSAIEPGLKMMEDFGFKILKGAYLATSYRQFAGTDDERAYDMQAMMDNEKVKAIVCARGGYGSIRILHKLNLNQFKEHPKWLIGFSDITAIHAFLFKNNVASLHAAMPRSYYDNDLKPTRSFNNLIKLLSGETLETRVNAHRLNRLGEVEGELIGGNLSMIYSLSGSPYDFDTCNKILFIEDLNEKLYHLDRMMMNLKLGGKLDQLKGLIVGGFTDMKDNDTPYGKSAYEIIAEHVKEYDYPVCYDYPVGHQAENYPLIVGKKAILKVEEKGSSLIQG